MGHRPPTACASPGCGGYAVEQGRGYCQKHRGDSPTLAGRRAYDRQRDQRYSSVRWRKFRQAVLVYNCICQRVEHGEQCTRPAAIIHHIIDPNDRPDLMYDASNVVAICPGHHHHHAGAQQGELYVPTRWMLDFTASVVDNEPDGVWTIK